MELSIKERKRLLNQLTEPEKTELQEQMFCSKPICCQTCNASIYMPQFR
jgi:NADPH-dependent glutamate synthase beta subunit-like oxidoreductase